MPIDTVSVMDLVCVLSENYNLQVTVKESLKGGLCAGAGAVAGGIVGGPIGMAVGGCVGACAAAYYARNNFQSAVTVIRKMSPCEQVRLAGLVTNIVRNLDVTDAVSLTAIVMGDVSVQKQIVGIVITFLKDELRMQVLD